MGRPLGKLVYGTINSVHCEKLDTMSAYLTR